MIKAILLQTPLLLASLFMVIVASLKAGKEKGGSLILCGAIGLVFLAVAGPMAYSGVAPVIIERFGPDRLELVYSLLGFVINVFWAGAIVLIALGILLRPVPGRRSSFESS